MYLPPHVSCLLPSLRVSRRNRVECDLEEFRHLLFLALHTVSVDEEWYIRAYPDVRGAIDAGQVSSATEHFRNTGYLEGRFPYEPLVDEAWYLERNQDVRKNLRADATATDHFLSSGYREGRAPVPPAVDAGWYLRTYPRARKDIDAGKAESAADHYLRIGYRLGMLPCRPAI